MNRLTTVVYSRIVGPDYYLMLHLTHGMLAVRKQGRCIVSRFADFLCTIKKCEKTLK